VAFDLCIGIDYSGAAEPASRLPGLQVCVAADGEPERVARPGSTVGRRRNRSRGEIAEWLIAEARSGRRFIAGIDHAFGLPRSHPDAPGPATWPGFLAAFVARWRTDERSVEAAPMEHPYAPSARRQLRLCEKWTSSAKSAFLFDVMGSVAKSTHAGLAWLARIREEVGERVHLWPFDG
jgi:hypothetical protein